MSEGVGRPRNQGRQRPHGARGRHLGDRPVAPVVRVHRPPPDGQGARPLPGASGRHHRRGPRSRPWRSRSTPTRSTPRTRPATPTCAPTTSSASRTTPRSASAAPACGPATARPSGRSTATSPSRARPARSPSTSSSSAAPSTPGATSGSASPASSPMSTGSSGAWSGTPPGDGRVPAGQDRPPGDRGRAGQEGLSSSRKPARAAGMRGPYQVRARPSASSTRAPSKAAATSAASALAERVRLGGEQHHLGVAGGQLRGVELGVAGGRVVQHRLAPASPSRSAAYVRRPSHSQGRATPGRRSGPAGPAGGGRRRPRPRPGRRPGRPPPAGRRRRRPGRAARPRPRPRWSAWSRTRPARPPPGAARPACGSPRRWPRPGRARGRGRPPGRGSWCPWTLASPSSAPAGSAPVGDPDQPLPHPGDDQPLGQRRDQAHHPPDPVGQRHRGAAGVGDVAHGQPRRRVRKSPSS